MPLAGIVKPERLTTTDQAYHAILSAIIDGSLPAGSPLGLQDLANTLEMSMMPIREAIRRLEGIGVVETVPHRGARVSPVSNEDLEETYLTRIIQEGALVWLAAHSFDETAAQECRVALDRQADAIARDDVTVARQEHERFHFRIYEAAGNRWLFNAMTPTWHNSARYRAASTADTASVAARRREHDRILAACAAGDPEKARQAQVNHLLASVRLLSPDVATRLTERLGEAFGRIAKSKA